MPWPRGGTRPRLEAGWRGGAPQRNVGERKRRGWVEAAGCALPTRGEGLQGGHKTPRAARKRNETDMGPREARQGTGLRKGADLEDIEGVAGGAGVEEAQGAAGVPVARLCHRFSHPLLLLFSHPLLLLFRHHL
eukprot:1582562-Rhodomonas_salina.1